MVPIHSLYFNLIDVLKMCIKLAFDVVEKKILN